MDEETIRRSNDLSKQIIGAAIEVHRYTGPGLLEMTYELCLCRELSLRGIPFQRQVELGFDYKGMEIEAGYRLDILVDNLVVVEIKSVERLEAIPELQLTTYLKMTGCWLGLLINFNQATVRDGLKRIVLG